MIPVEFSEETGLVIAEHGAIGFDGQNAAAVLPPALVAEALAEHLGPNAFIDSQGMTSVKNGVVALEPVTPEAIAAIRPVLIGQLNEAAVTELESSIIGVPIEGGTPDSNVSHQLGAMSFDGSDRAFFQALPEEVASILSEHLSPQAFDKMVDVDSGFVLFGGGNGVIFARMLPRDLAELFEESIGQAAKRDLEDAIGGRR